MMTLIEDLRAELRQMCRAMGISGTATTVVPLVVLGIALNLIALRAVGSVRTEHHAACEAPVLRNVARTELKVARAVLVSTLKKIGDGQRRWCSVQQHITAQQAELTHAPFKGGFAA